LRRKSIALVFLSIFTFAWSSCGRTSAEHVTVALPEPFSTFDTLTTEKSDAAAERVRNLMFNSLIRKSENFEYVGELAKELTPSADGRVLTLVLHEGIKFHNGKHLTSADVKYTFEELFRSKGYKSFAFYDTVDKKSVAHILALETPDPVTVVFRLERPALLNQLLSNLVAVPIIAEGTAAEQRSTPVGTGPFRFVSFDPSQNIVELEAFADYWDKPATVKKLRLKTVTDASALQAELQTGGVDLAPNPSNLPPDALEMIRGMANLKVEKFDGSNIQYIGLNTRSAPLDNVKVRQAIGFAIDREKIIRDLLSGQAKMAHSILPEASWAYSPGTTYSYDPGRSRQLLAEAGYRNEPISFKFAAGNAAYRDYVQAIHSMLTEAGLNVQIESLDTQTIRENLAKGQFQMNTGVWVGGNQDPIFLRDLFTTAKIPGEGVTCCNRSRYSDPKVDELIAAAVNETDRQRARELYVQAWEIISRDNPLFPLWYPANMVVSNERVGNIKIGPSGDWGFIKDITLNN
jgi:peptide/nickel transport system substrate-binding protein